MFKNSLHNLFNFYIFSNIHVAIVAFSLTKLTLLEVGISQNTIPFFVFFSTLVSYNFIRFMRMDTIKSWYSGWVEENKYFLYILNGIAIVFLIYFGLKLRFKAVLILFPFAVLTFFYVFPVSKFSLREKSGLKLFLIAISWAGITVLFPLKQNYMIIRVEDIITFIQRFFLIFSLTLLFDIRDLAYDKDSLKTIPQLVGVKKSKHIALVSILFFFSLEFFKTYDLKQLLVVLLITILAIVFILKASVNRSKYYTSFFVEAIPIVWLVLFLYLV